MIMPNPEQRIKEGTTQAIQGSGTGTRKSNAAFNYFIYFFIFRTSEPGITAPLDPDETEKMDQISAKRLTAGHAEGSEIGVDAVEVEEGGARDGSVGGGDADEATRGEEEGEAEEEEEGDDDAREVEGTGTGDSGEVIGGSGCEAEENVLVLFGLGFIGASASFGVPFAVGVNAAGGECALQH